MIFPRAAIVLFFLPRSGILFRNVLANRKSLSYDIVFTIRRTSLERILAEPYLNADEAAGIQQSPGHGSLLAGSCCASNSRVGICCCCYFEAVRVGSNPTFCTSHMIISVYRPENILRDRFTEGISLQVIRSYNHPIITPLLCSRGGNLQRRNLVLSLKP